MLSLGGNNPPSLFPREGKAVHRFFIDDGKLEEGQELSLPAEESHHIDRVLRLLPGSTIFISDGKGRSFKASITGKEKNRVKVKLLTALDERVEPPVSVTLVQGLPKGEKMDIIVQKAVELGVEAVMPVVTERSVVSFSPEKARRKQERWQRIARAAAAQSQRCRIPKVYPVCPFPDILKKCSDLDLVLLLYEKEQHYGIKDITGNRSISSIMVIVGPEGGLTREEADLARAAGAQSVRLGPRILRTETAALAALAIILSVYGDLGVV